jgi:ribosome-binding ATPase YchF (GTP1/OBG family)
LSHIRAVDGIVHVMRAFEDPDIVHVEDRVDPVADIEIISNELRQKDIEAIDRRLADLNRCVCVCIWVCSYPTNCVRRTWRPWIGSLPI